MSKSTVLIAYYTRTGNTEKMARAIARGVEAAGLTARVKEVEACTLDDLRAAGAIVIGSPTYFSNVAWPVKKLIDESIALYRGHELRGKVAGIFTSSGTARDAQDCLRMLELAWGLHHQMQVVKPGLVRVDGSPEDQTEREGQAYGEKIAQAIKQG
ncbi:MAG TPA: flavodoxin family protein [Armatimonadetes bacterium]|nr:flavodoxin family protein [Armatimonadota bacterium]